MRSQLLGAYINGIQNFLVITGDPIPSMVRTTVKSVFNFDSVGLMQILADMNEEQFTQAPASYGGAINQAGSVKGKQSAKHAVSDWMDIEKQRGISVTSSVLQFNYAGKCVNILDTPGHQDFSEDTYRTPDGSRLGCHGHRRRKGRRGPDHQAV